MGHFSIRLRACPSPPGFLFRYRGIASVSQVSPLRAKMFMLPQFIPYRQVLALGGPSPGQDLLLCPPSLCFVGLTSTYMKKDFWEFSPGEICSGPRCPCLRPHRGSLGLGQWVHVLWSGPFWPFAFGKGRFLCFCIVLLEETILFRVFFSPSLRTAQNLWGGVGTATAGELGDEETMTEAKSGGQQDFSLSYLLLTGPGKCFSLDLVAPNCYPFSLGLKYLSPHKWKVKMLLNCTFLSLHTMSQKTSHSLSSPVFPASLPPSSTQSLDLAAWASLQGWAPRFLSRTHKPHSRLVEHGLSFLHLIS